MPFYFAGKLESCHVCEYFRMMQLFYDLGIPEHNEILYEMGIKEKEYEIYFLSKIKYKKMLPLFEKLFASGDKNSCNDFDPEKMLSNGRIESVQ
jgi:hypothetical protein